MNRLFVLGDLFAFMWQRKAWWLAPLILSLSLLAVLLIFSQSSVLAPIFYPLF